MLDVRQHWGFLATNQVDVGRLRSRTEGFVWCCEQGSSWLVCKHKHGQVQFALKGWLCIQGALQVGSRGVWQEVCCQCSWWGREKSPLVKGKAQINYLLVLQFVSDCAQHSRLVYRFNICLYLKVCA